MFDLIAITKDLIDKTFDSVAMRMVYASTLGLRIRNSAIFFLFLWLFHVQKFFNYYNSYVKVQIIYR